MSQPISPEALKQVFTEARTHHHWQKKAVSEELLRSVYDLAKWGPTAANGNPMRILFIKSEKEKERLVPALMGSNVEQVRAAPVTAVIAFDEKFYDHFPRLFPVADIRPMFVSDTKMSETTALRNGSLQGAYFMLAARALGLDIGAMSGFNNALVDETFFKGTSWKSNFLVNLGYGEAEKVFPRGARFSFEEAAKII